VRTVDRDAHFDVRFTERHCEHGPRRVVVLDDEETNRLVAIIGNAGFLNGIAGLREPTSAGCETDALIPFVLP